MNRSFRFPHGARLAIAMLIATASLPALAAQPAANGSVNSQAISTSTPDNSPADSGTHVQAEIVVHDQSVQHREALFARLQTPDTAWLVLSRGNGHGQMNRSKVIGRVHVSPGVHTNVIVHLTEVLAPGEYVYAVLHHDNGQKNKYEYHNAMSTTDAPMVVNGEVVQARFKVLKSAKKRPHHVPASTAKPGQAGPSSMQGASHDSPNSKDGSGQNGQDGSGGGSNGSSSNS